MSPQFLAGERGFVGAIMFPLMRLAIVLWTGGERRVGGGKVERDDLETA